jgi:hypothetical protein
MKSELLAALDRVPAEAPNRDKLATLLLAVEQAREEIAADAVASEWHARIHCVASLLHLAECSPKRTPAAGKAYRELQKAINAARMYAERHKLKPNTRRGVVKEAAAVLEAVR